MNKYEFRDELEELIHSYLEDKSVKDLPDVISFHYTIDIEDGSYGQVVFYSKNRDVALKIQNNLHQS